MKINRMSMKTCLQIQMALRERRRNLIANWLISAIDPQDIDSMLYWSNQITGLNDAELELIKCKVM